MSDRVTQIEAEAEATAEIGGALPEANLEAQFRALAAGNVDDELTALKKRMALAAAEDERRAIGGTVTPPSASAGAGASASSAADDAGDEDAGDVDDAKAAEIDAQLEELKRKLSAT
jgi:phage shock protein A